MSFLMFLALTLSCSISRDRSTNDQSNAPFESTHWVLIELRDLNSVKAEQEVFIEFPDDQGNLRGSAGCNNFFGGYDITENNLKIGPLGTTMRMCEDMTVENTLLKALEEVTRYEIKGSQMTFYIEEDQVVIFQALDAE